MKKEVIKKKEVVKKKKMSKVESEFEEFWADADPKDAIPYSMKASFGVNALIDHKKFGLGKVSEVITPNKIAVKFREGERILICVLKED